MVQIFCPSHRAFSSRKVYGFCGTPCRKAVEGVERPDGVLAPSPIGLRLDAWSTWGLKETGVGATRAVTVLVGMYVGTEATAGLVGVDGGVTRGGGGDTGGV